MEERKKAIIPSFLLGQLLATVQLIEEDVKSHDAPSDNSLTIAETYFNDMIENPQSTLNAIESRLNKNQQRLSNPGDKKLIRDMTLIRKIKNQYQMTDEHLNEDEFFKGYFQQLKRYYHDDPVET